MAICTQEMHKVPNFDELQRIDRSFGGKLDHHSTLEHWKSGFNENAFVAATARRLTTGCETG